MNISLSESPSDRTTLLALEMSFPMANRSSTAALDGTAMLYLMNRSIKTCSPKKATSVKTSLEPASSQVFTKFCALDFTDLWLLLSYCVCLSYQLLIDAAADIIDVS